MNSLYDNTMKETDKCNRVFEKSNFVVQVRLIGLITQSNNYHKGENADGVKITTSVVEYTN